MTNQKDSFEIREMKRERRVFAFHAKSNSIALTIGLFIATGLLCVFIMIANILMK